MRHGIKFLTAALILSFTLGVCACERDLPMREDLEPKVVTYIENKYGFEPEILDWRTEDEPITRSYSHYVTVSDGTNEFEVRVGGTSNIVITDDYEKAAIYEDMREWADSILPGAVHAFCDHEFFNEEQKYTGDVWEFMEEYNVYPSITFTYVDQPLDGDEAMTLFRAIEELGVTNEYSIVSCPSEEAAEIVWANAFVGGYSDIISYAPYVDESLSYHSPSYDIQYHRYDVREVDGFCYYENVAHGEEPTPDNEFGIAKTDDCVLSDLFPTYMVSNNRSDLDNYARADITLYVFVPLSMIDEEIVYGEDHDRPCASNLIFVHTSDPNGEPTEAVMLIIGDYAMFGVSSGLGGEYFSINRAS